MYLKFGLDFVCILCEYVFKYTERVTDNMIIAKSGGKVDCCSSKTTVYIKGQIILNDS